MVGAGTDDLVQRAAGKLPLPMKAPRSGQLKKEPISIPSQAAVERVPAFLSKLST